jgi:hypothetical protein
MNCSGGGSGGGSAAGGGGGGGGGQASLNCDYYCTNFHQEFDNDMDTNIDAIVNNTYIYIGSDRATGVIDYDGDAINPYRQIEISYTNDFTNNELTIVERRQYPTAAGTPDDRITTIWALDIDGRREIGEIAIDKGDDGIIEARTWITLTYDVNTGVLLQEEGDIDDNNDNIVDSQYIRTYTPTYGPGDRIDENTIEYDSDNDGTVDERRTVTNTYDLQGRRITMTVKIDSDGDTDGNDTIDVQQDSTYSHDANGNEVEEVVTEDNDLDGQADSTWTNTWTYTKKCGDTLSEPLNPLDWPI